MSLHVDASVRVGDHEIVAAFTVDDGTTVAIAGPNGAGKTTLLHAVAGLRPLCRGSVHLGDDVLEDVALGVRLSPVQRHLGVVFQDRLLFPHLDAAENVAFGLRSHGRSRSAARREAQAWLERVGLVGRADARPAELSGGEAQRVALARALAAAPAALLLDEPLASLDVESRHAVRRELYRHLAGFAGPRLLVTHDPVELASLADRVVVLEAGRIVQTGTVAEVTARPRSAWAAELAGVNLLRGRADGTGAVDVGGAAVVAATTATGDVLLAIPPAAVALYRELPDGSPRNGWRMQVASLDRHGDRVRAVLDGPFRLVAEITPAAVSALSLGAGGDVWAVVKATEIRAYPD